MALPMDEAIGRAQSLLSFVRDVRETAAALQQPSSVPIRRGTPAPRGRVARPDDERLATEIRRANHALIVAFVERLEWTISVPGFDQLLGFLRAMEKDLVADSASLRNRLKVDLLIEFESYPQVVGAPQLQQFAGVFVLDTIKLRFSGAIGDVRVRANTDHWTRYKASRGLPLQVGVYEGLLINAIETVGVISFS
jgi:hypothetical protein